MADEVKREPYLYILVATDLNSLNGGKAIAQGGHSCNKFTDDHIIKPLLAGEKPDELVMEWRAAADGFGTTIALAVGSVRTLVAKVREAAEAGFKTNFGKDPTYPYFTTPEIASLIPVSIHTAPSVVLNPKTALCFREEIPTAYVFGYKDELQPILGGFDLVDWPFPHKAA